MNRSIADKFLWQQEYKFSIACENSSKPGYTTEKILEVLQANTVPIYWGNPLIEKDFSKDCFINAMNFASLDELVEYIKYIDQNDEEYLKILKSPWYPSDAQKKPYLTEDNNLKQFLFAIFDQDTQEAKRIPNGGRAPLIYTHQTRTISRYNTIRHPIKNLFNCFCKRISRN